MMVCVWMAPWLLRLADWGTTLQKLVVCLTWAASIALAMQLQAGRLWRLSLAAVSILVVLGAAAATIGARQPGAEPSSGKRPLDIELAIERYATVDASLSVVLDLVRPMVTDTHSFDEVRRLGDVTDDRALRAIPLRVVERSGHGNLVLVGSTAGRFGEAGHADYAAAKSAIQVGLLLSLKNEIVRIAPRGRVNAVAPGWTYSPMTRGELDEALVSRISRTMALRKVAQADDIARAVVVLASDELSGHVTGELVTVAGGMGGRTLHEA